jgi:hypothetical protein
MQALVHRVAALLQNQQPDIGILDRQQLKDSLAQRIRSFIQAGRAAFRGVRYRG